MSKNQIKYFLSSFFIVVLSSFSYGQNPTELLLKNYRPKSIFKIPVTSVQKAKFPVIDMHSHDNLSSKSDIEEWIKTMDSAGIEKSIILTYSTGKAFDSIIVFGKIFSGDLRRKHRQLEWKDLFCNILKNGATDCVSYSTDCVNYF